MKFKRNVIILGLCLLPMALSSCTNQPLPQEKIVEVNTTPAYQLFPTQNMWTFIKLDTRNGMMWQVQYDVKGNNRMEVILNNASLVPQADYRNGRFTLYPTTNMYNFILLDQISGKTWQVQWSIEEENRLILPISNTYSSEETQNSTIL